VNITDYIKTYGVYTYNYITPNAIFDIFAVKYEGNIEVALSVIGKGKKNIKAYEEKIVIKDRKDNSIIFTTLNDELVKHLNDYIAIAKITNTKDIDIEVYKDDNIDIMYNDRLIEFGGTYRKGVIIKIKQSVNKEYQIEFEEKQNENTNKQL
jgi:hypothetical protein